MIGREKQGSFRHVCLSTEDMDAWRWSENYLTNILIEMFHPQIYFKVANMLQ